MEPLEGERNALGPLSPCFHSPMSIRKRLHLYVFPCDSMHSSIDNREGLSSATRDENCIVQSSKTIVRSKNFQTTIFSSATFESRDIKMDVKRGNKGWSKNFIFECNARWSAVLRDTLTA